MIKGKSNRKRFGKRLLTALLACALLSGQPGFRSVISAEEGAQTEAPAPPETDPPAPPETDPPAPPETDPPAPPETDPPAPPETEAPAPPETEAPAPPETEAPAPPETEAPAQQTEAPGTEAAAEEKTTEKQTEKETETEAKKYRKFSASIGNGTIKVKLSKKDALEEDAQLVVTAVTRESDPASWERYAAALRPVTDHGHRRLASAVFYHLEIRQGSNAIIPAHDAKVTITYDVPVAASLTPDYSPEFLFFPGLGGAPQAAEMTVSTQPTGSPNPLLAQGEAVSGLVWKGPWNADMALAEVADHVNDGDAVTASALNQNLSSFTDHYAVITRIWGSLTELPAQVCAAQVPQEDRKQEERRNGKDRKDSKKTLPDPGEIRDTLAGLGDYSLVLANSVSTDSVKVVNLYADQNGNIDQTPMKAVLSASGAVDVTGCVVLVNIAAFSAGQALSVPVWPLENAANAGTTAADQEKINAGRIVYNIVAQGDELSPTVFSGSLSLQGEGKGTYLAPSAAVDLSSGLTGVLFAGSVSGVSDGSLKRAYVLYDPEEEAARKKEEAEAATEKVTEAATEKVTEAAAEKATEAATEAVTEAATETVTEAATEAATEVVTEAATEAATEETVEAVTEPATEEITEKATEAATEKATEAATEKVTEAATEEATEAATEEATEAVTEEATEAVTEEITENVTEEAAEEITEIATEADPALKGESESSVTISLGTGTDKTKEETIIVNNYSASFVLEDESKKAIIFTNGEISGEVVTGEAARYVQPEVTMEQNPELAALLETGEPVKVTVTADLPEGYKWSDGEALTETPGERTLWILKTSEGLAVEPETFYFEVVEKIAVPLKIAAVRSDDETAYLAAEYSVAVAGQELMTGIQTDDSGAKEVKFYPEDYADKDIQEINDFLNGTSDELKLTVTETKTPALFNEPSPKEQEVTFVRNKEINPDTLEETVTYTIGNPENGEVTYPHDPVKLTIKAMAEYPAGTVIPGAAFTIDAEKADQQTAGNVTTFTVVPADESAFRALVDKTADSATLKVTESTVPAGYLAPKTAMTLKAALNEDGTLSLSSSDGMQQGSDENNWEAHFAHNVKKLTVNVQAEDYNNKKGLPATFRLMDANGNWITKNGSVVELTSTGSAVQAVLTAAECPQLKSAFDASSMSVTVVQMTTAENYIIVGSAKVDVPVSAADWDAAASSGNVTKNVVFRNRTTETTDTLRVRKEWYVGDNKRIYNTKDAQTFYVALFSDSARTNRISGIYKVTASAGSPYKNYNITNLPARSYYVGEVDAEGNLIRTSASGSQMYVTYSSTNGGVNIRSTTATTRTVTLKNHYPSLPDNAQYVALIGIRKQVTKVGEDKKEAIDESFGGTIKVRVTYKNDGKTYKQEKSITVAKGTSSYKAVYIPLGTASGDKKVNVYEVIDNKAYTNGATVTLAGSSYDVKITEGSNTEGVSAITVRSDQSSAPLVTVTNTYTEKKEDPEKTQAELKLTKKVTYKGNAMRVNSGYYIGIFDDAALTKLRYKRPLALKNASEATASLKINLYKLKSRQVTFYFAEVDKNGKIVESGTKTGYNISQNKKSITLNEDNMEDEVIVTNDIVAGSKREKALTDPRSGFAGDASAVAEAREIERTGNSSASTATGNNIPIGPVVALLVVSLLLIIGLTIGIILYRKKSRNRR